jgi:2-oxo-4-hydroxy-4-carboxy--5-ureidoimidazoline (OHCU) decarboxylase
MAGSLPALSEIRSAPLTSDSPLAVALNVLFEHSTILVTRLAPQLHALFDTLAPGTLESYSQFIDITLDEIGKWDMASQAEFISGHPRIGETKGLSKLSSSEQGAQGVNPTPPEVLVRLTHLNGLYEVKYPGLRYITFVNGRTRASIAEELEDVLGISHSLSPIEPDSGSIIPVDPSNKEWKDELNRAVYDIGRIAKSRLKVLEADNSK